MIKISLVILIISVLILANTKNIFALSFAAGSWGFLAASFIIYDVFINKKLGDKNES